MGYTKGPDYCDADVTENVLTDGSKVYGVLVRFSDGVRLRFAMLNEEQSYALRDSICYAVDLEVERPVPTTIEAAAPDLLEACREAEGYLDLVPPMPDAWSDGVVKAMRALRDAIRKAEGKE